MSDQTGPYDPNAIEGEKPVGAQYINIKDLRVLGVFALVFAPLMFFVYGFLKKNSERHICTSNLNAIYKAINMYAEQHDNRFPPLARTEGDGLTPNLDEQGRPYTWVSDTEPFMNSRQSFVCPTSTDAERVHNESPDSVSKSILSSYGMYAPYGGSLTSNVELPEQVILVAETSDQGTESTLDSKPFGKNVPNGFVIGWSDTNSAPDKGTSSVTRLAFPGQGKGETKLARHGSFIQSLSASGELLQLGPDDAAYHAGGGINSHWRLPPGYRPQTP